jgi:hypothetical protein
MPLFGDEARIKSPPHAPRLFISPSKSTNSFFLIGILFKWFEIIFSCSFIK